VIFNQRMKLNIRIARKLGWKWTGERWNRPDGTNCSLKFWTDDIAQAVTLMPKKKRPDPLKICRAFLNGK
jgi:hypothetical protein